MSANPQAMAQMLAQQLGQQPGSGGSPLGAASQLAQKIMLMQALQKGQPQQPQVPPVLPGAMQPPQMNMPMPGGVNA